MLLIVIFINDQDYVPLHDAVVAKAKWEAEQVELNATLQTELAR